MKGAYTSVLTQAQMNWETPGMLFYSPVPQFFSSVKWESWFLPVSVSWDCRNKVPQTGSLTKIILPHF